MTVWHGLPAAVYRLVEHMPGSVLLESAARPNVQPDDEPHSAASPPSRLFIAPKRVLTARDPQELTALFCAIEKAVDAGQYAAGYFSYECGACFEPAPGLPGDGSIPTVTAGPPVTEGAPATAGPLAWFGVYAQEYVFDHRCGAFVGGDPEGLDEFREPADRAADPAAGTVPDAAAQVTEPEYAGQIARIHELIGAGDVYQLNFTIPLAVRTEGRAAALYSRLRMRQPAPYGAFLHTQQGQRILCFSPELLFRIDERAPTRRITTRPMKGTAPRGRNTAEDRAQAAWLAADPKNRAENVMIVDLVRNDLGRLCTFGSVRVEGLFAVERYPTLWQMTSTVSGDLRPGVGYEQVFRALFPCGSVTGAPKIRAMQWIGELEGRPRGVYTGAIGYFSRERTVFNVAIRTLTLDAHGAGEMGVGSGIVIDSEASAEWRECQLKAEFLTGRTGIEGEVQPDSFSPGSFSLIETLLWNGEYPLLELHLDRLQDSARYFDFPFDRAAVGAALASHTFADSLARNSSTAGADLLNPNRKVRLLLHSDGSIEIGFEAISDPSTNPLRVRIATRRTDSRDLFYFHKTTHRPVYAAALQAAFQAGCDDVLFLNERSEVTEGAIHNLFIEKAGRLLTPPIECGVLPGVQRRHILATQPDAEERVLTLEDLRSAEAVYLSNAVRGLRRAVIEWGTELAPLAVIERMLDSKREAGKSQRR